jgi:hypothetical protein
MDLSSILGTNGGISVQCLTLYIPDRDRQGREFGSQRKWILEAARLLARMGGGVTIMPAFEGGWLAEDRELVWDRPVLVYTFIRPDSFLAALPDLRTFLHSLGRETNQGEVVFEFDGRFYRIAQFDPQGE